MHFVQNDRQNVIYLWIEHVLWKASTLNCATKFVGIWQYECIAIVWYGSCGRIELNGRCIRSNVASNGMSEWNEIWVVMLMRAYAKISMHATRIAFRRSAKPIRSHHFLITGNAFWFTVTNVCHCKHAAVSMYNNFNCKKKCIIFL